MRRFLRHAVVLGLITAVGPFAIDMYLPALPTIGASLAATPAAVQMSLMAYFITIGICQLFYGPLTDMLGRKTPIYAGLVIFAIGSVGCALSQTIESLILFRMVQAVGACGGMVVPRAIVRDLHTGPDAARLMAMLMLVMSISPMLAPLTGSVIIAHFGWRAVFWTLVVAAGIGFLLAFTQLEETRPAHARTASTWTSALQSYATLLRDPLFLGLTFVGAFGVSTFFIYLGNAAFIFIDHYGLTPTQFSLCFALNAAAFFGCSQMTGRLAHRYGLAAVIRVAITGVAAALVLVAVLMAAGFGQMALMMALLFAGYGCLGLVMPATAVLSLEHHGAIAGTASALMGAIQMVTGAGAMALAGIFATGHPVPMVTAIAVCGTLAFLVAQITLRRPQAAA